jgi:hypothetical protein
MIFNGTTIAFSTKANVWKTRYSFTPTCYMTMDNDFLSSNTKQTSDELMWRHDQNSLYNSFYDNPIEPSSLEVVSNQNPSAVKIFKALSLETDAKVWTGSVYTNKTRDPFAFQQGDLKPFVQKEGNQYVDMPRSSRNSSSNITFIGTVALADFGEDYVFANMDDSRNFAFRLKNTPDVAIPASLLGGSFLYVGNPPTLIGSDGIFMSLEQGYPSTSDGNWLEVYSYNGNSNTLTVGLSNLVFTQQQLALHSIFNGDAIMNWLDDGNQSDVPIYIMTNPVLDGDNMRGPYAGIKLTSPNSSSGFELFSINVDYENTKLDGSLG